MSPFIRKYIEELNCIVCIVEHSAHYCVCSTHYHNATLSNRDLVFNFETVLLKFASYSSTTEKQHITIYIYIYFEY